MIWRKGVKLLFVFFVGLFRLWCSGFFCAPHCEFSLFFNFLMLKLWILFCYLWCLEQNIWDLWTVHSQREHNGYFHLSQLFQKEIREYLIFASPFIILAAFSQMVPSHRNTFCIPYSFWTMEPLWDAIGRR